MKLSKVRFLYPLYDVTDSDEEVPPDKVPTLVIVVQLDNTVNYDLYK